MERWNTYEDAVESFRVMSCCELTGILHMVLEIPELA